MSDYDELTEQSDEQEEEEQAELGRKIADAQILATYVLMRLLPDTMRAIVFDITVAERDRIRLVSRSHDCCHWRFGTRSKSFLMPTGPTGRQPSLPHLEGHPRTTR